MTIREAIDRADTLNPNQYTEEQKVKWLSLLDYSVFTDIINEHEYNEGEETVEFRPYTTDDVEKTLLASYPYDEMYVVFLQMKIDEANKETDRYNNSAALFNSYSEDFSHHYHKTHRSKKYYGFNIWG